MKHIGNANLATVGAAVFAFVNTVTAQTTVTFNIGNPESSTPPYYGLFVNTGISVTKGEWISINSDGLWTYQTDAESVGNMPDGLSGSGHANDCFLGNDLFAGLIAYVGGTDSNDDPFQGHWPDLNNSFFPTTNYWQCGTSVQFMSDRDGYLWLGFNDDSQEGSPTDDNGGTTISTIWTGFSANSVSDPNLTLSVATVSANSFAFTISGGIPGSACAIYDSSDLTHWTLIDAIVLDSNGSTQNAYDLITESFLNGPFENNTGPDVSCRFYMVCDGQFISKTIGFVRQIIPAENSPSSPSITVIANQFDGPNGNTLDGLFNPMPDGTTLPSGVQIVKRSGSTYNYYTWTGSWGGNGGVTMNPGEGAFIENPTTTSFAVTVAGVVREGTSSLSIPYSGSNPSLISSILPKAGYLQTTLGYSPHPGDKIELWNGSGWTVYSYDPNDTSPTWTPSEPVLNAGQGFYIIPALANTWTETYSSRQFAINSASDPNLTLGVAPVSGGLVSANSFAFTISGGIPGSACAIYDSSDLTHWTLIDAIMLDSNGSSGSASDLLWDGGVGFDNPFGGPLVSGVYQNLTGVSYRFYKVCDGQSVSKTIGFVRLMIPAENSPSSPSITVIANQFDGPSGNTLDGLFNPMPDGTTLPSGVQIVKRSGSAYDYYTWNGSWDGNGGVTLNPGEGAFIENPTTTSFAVTFAGIVREGTSSLSIPYSGSNPSLISSILPEAGYLQTTLGYSPHPGDTIELWNGSGWTAYYYDPNDTSPTWTPSEPILNAGEGFYIIPALGNTWNEIYSSLQF